MSRVSKKIYVFIVGMFIVLLIFVLCIVKFLFPTEIKELINLLQGNKSAETERPKNSSTSTTNNVKDNNIIDKKEDNINKPDVIKSKAQYQKEFQEFRLAEKNFYNIYKKLEHLLFFPMDEPVTEEQRLKIANQIVEVLSEINAPNGPLEQYNEKYQIVVANFYSLKNPSEREKEIIDAIHLQFASFTQAYQDYFRLAKEVLIKDFSFNHPVLQDDIYVRDTWNGTISDRIANQHKNRKKNFSNPRNYYYHKFFNNKKK